MKGLGNLPDRHGNTTSNVMDRDSNDDERPMPETLT